MTDETNRPAPSMAQKVYQGHKSNFAQLYIDSRGHDSSGVDDKRSYTITYPDGSRLFFAAVILPPGDEKHPLQRTYEAQRQAWTDAVGTVNNDTPSE